MKNSNTNAACHCKSNACPNQERKTPKGIKKILGSVPSVVLSILVAVFPKCPLCWAVYMSMLGSFGLAKIPFMGWLLPVFIGFLGLHLWLLWRRTGEKGYGPFVVSLIGFSILLSAKLARLDLEWISASGMLFIAVGSFWNSFSAPKLHIV
ncbi:hypothetical protein [Flavobacterium humi]|uniref:MerC domain-containing protein n=1 Tax=Flavobacterium humi TaxID=2562683 RepID=A0A4Z0LCG9_9FLAO|nr:hypothetical protein [Flavobacterium humi]TGD59567.1 hypothetical protein E4635_01135 [Flavobacterium humi]